MPLISVVVSESCLMLRSNSPYFFNTLNIRLLGYWLAVTNDMNKIYTESFDAVIKDVYTLVKMNKIFLMVK